MANILWQYFDSKDKEDYLRKIEVLGMLSGLFKELDGANGQKPYLHYRNHEISFIQSLGVTGITRKDSAFDAIANIENKNIGIGLKTWIHSNDITNQKVAEFNKKSKELRLLYDSDKDKELAIKIAELRNKRIEDDKRLYETEDDIYHFVTRDDNKIYLSECLYECIDVNNIKNIKRTKSSIVFTDGKSNYLFNMSKSTLFKSFDASEAERFKSMIVNIAENPFQILDEVWLKLKEKEEKNNSLSSNNSIFLPLYNEAKYIVNSHSVFNASLAKPKVKGSTSPRPAYEAYAPIPKWVHIAYPNFFGFDALNKESRSKSYFNLHLPSGRVIQAKLTQDNGKGMQTSPQSILGKWLLFNIFGLKEYEPLTRELLDDKQIDSLIITRVGKLDFKVDIANYLDYERWKIQQKDKLMQLKEDGLLSPRAVPKFREELF